MSLQFLQFLTPSQPVMTSDYDGLEYRWKMFIFRPALFQQEAFLLAAVLFYVAVYFIGKKINATRANKWFEAHRSLLEAQFAKPWAKDGLIQDGNSDFFVYSTGRRALTSLHTTFTLRPRHDLVQTAFHFARGLIELDYRPFDEVELDFTFRDAPGKDNGVPECVWAVVAKDQIRGIKENRWDLTFTKTTDNPNLPPSLTVMSEFADVTSNLLKPLGPLSLPAVLSDPAILPYFRSLSLTDQPRTRPSAPPAPGARTRHLILSLALPPASAAQVTRPLLAAAFQLVDAIAGEGRAAGGRGGLAAALRPETKAKLRKVREDLARELREDAGKEKREEQAEEKAAAKRKAEEERVSKLSAAEQKKEMERDKKRLMRKTQGKVKMR